MRRTRAQLDAIVLDAIGEQSRSAYEIAATVPAQHGPLRPPQVYRVLHRLVREGAVRRVELTQGYVAHAAPDALALCCRLCGTTTFAPAPGVVKALEGIASAVGFNVDRMVIECDGLCGRCAAMAPTG